MFEKTFINKFLLLFHFKIMSKIFFRCQCSTSKDLLSQCSPHLIMTGKNNLATNRFILQHYFDNLLHNHVLSYFYSSRTINVNLIPEYADYLVKKGIKGVLGNIIFYEP